MNNEENLKVTEQETNIQEEEKTNITEDTIMDEKNGLTEWIPIMARSNGMTQSAQASAFSVTSTSCGGTGSTGGSGSSCSGGSGSTCGGGSGSTGGGSGSSCSGGTGSTGGSGSSCGGGSGSTGGSGSSCCGGSGSTGGTGSSCCGGTGSSCSGGTSSTGGSGSSNGSCVKVNCVELSKSTLTLIVNEAYKLTTIICPSNATDKCLIWKSSDEKIAIVSNIGLIFAKKNGSVTITVTTYDGSKKAECCVNVIASLVTDKPESGLGSLYNEVLKEGPYSDNIGLKKADEAYEFIKNIYSTRGPRLTFERYSYQKELRLEIEKVENSIDWLAYVAFFGDIVIDYYTLQLSPDIESKIKLLLSGTTNTIGLFTPPGSPNLSAIYANLSNFDMEKSNKLNRLYKEFHFTVENYLFLPSEKLTIEDKVDYESKFNEIIRTEINRIKSKYPLLSREVLMIPMFPGDKDRYTTEYYVEMSYDDEAYVYHLERYLQDKDKNKSTRAKIVLYSY